MACLDPVAMDSLLADLSDNDDLEITPGDGSPIKIQGPEDGLPINIEGLGRDNTLFDDVGRLLIELNVPEGLEFDKMMRLWTKEP